MREANEAVSENTESESNNLQGYTVCLIGHLFDNHSFSKCIDACEQNGVNFRVIEWAIGQSENQETQVTIQCIAEHEPALDASRERLSTICAENGVRMIDA